MAAVNVKITNELKNPSEAGTHYRLLCMTGPNKGKVYYLTGKRILIGRGDKADIQIVDTKISREHAELSLVEGGYVVTDMSNQNGIVINDKKVKQQLLQDGEKVVIGQSVLKYNILYVREESNELVNIDENVIALATKNAKKTLATKKIQANIASRFDDDEDSKNSNEVGPGKIAVLVIVVGGILYLLMAGDGKATKDPKTSTKKSEDAFDIQSATENTNNSKLNKSDADVKRKFDMLIHSGRREFREGNYFRAMEEFRRADLVVPGSSMASYLMSRAKQRLDDDVAKNFDKANRDLDAKKFQSAINSFCGVMQLLQKYPEDERYKNAQEKLSALEIEMGLDKGEIKCFETKPTGTGR
jgi:pSer/pThr/pTyr-binding forkhead associated (FHA) protein